MVISSFLRRGLLSALFGLIATTGALSKAEAHEAENDALDTQTAASAELEALRQAYAKRMDPRVALGVIDMDQFAPATSNTPGFGSLLSALRADGHLLDAKSIFKIFEKATVTPGRLSMVADIDLAQYTLSPQAFSSLRSTDGQNMCVIAPALADNLPFVIPGLSDTQATRFTNRHEFHHCLNNNLGTLEAMQTKLLEGQMDMPHVLTLEEDDIAVLRLIFSLQYIAQNVREESLADMGALSDMIAHDDAPVDAIHAVAAWRATRLASTPGDVIHYSTPALNALADHIESIGIDRFRMLSDTERSALSQRIYDEHGLTGSAALLVITHLARGAATPKLKANTVELTITDNDRQRAAWTLSYIDSSQDVPSSDMGDIAFTPQQIKTLSQWDAAKELQQRARRLNGKITQLSLLAAQADMLDDIRAQQRARPHDIMPVARAALIKKAFRTLFDAQPKTSGRLVFNKHPAAVRANRTSP